MSYKAALNGQPRVFAVDDGDHHSSSTAENPKRTDTPTNMGNHGATSSSSSGLVGAAPDSLSQIMIAHRLNENNYLQWSRNILMYVRGKKKAKYLTEDPPSADSAEFETWCAENNMVMAWLVNSMTVEISENYLLATTAKEIWDSARRTFSVRENIAAIIQVKRALRELYQGEKSVTQYYTTLVKLWQRLDLYETYEWSCHADIMYHKRLLDRERCCDFLLGLNDSYEDARGRIMSIKPLPLLEDTFNMVKCEESRKLLTQGPPSHAQITQETSALAVRGNHGDMKTRKSVKWCDHCNKSGHTKEECWKLHGKPPNMKQKGRNDKKGLVVSTPETEGATLSTEELMVLRRILDKHSESSSAQLCEKITPSITLAKSGTALTCALSGMSISKDIGLWILAQRTI